jgi:hypothetical protein
MSVFRALSALRIEDHRARPAPEADSMSLIAIPALPMSKSRPPGRPSAEHVATRETHLKALELVTKYKMTHQQVAQFYNRSERSIYRWLDKAIDYPEAKQILSDYLD